MGVPCGAQLRTASQTSARRIVKPSRITIRAATADDVPSINRIYNRYIVDSHVSFDTRPWSDGERHRWFAERTAAGFPIVVAERKDGVIGAAWAGPWRSKEAYDRSAEATIVLDPEVHGAGVGTALYRVLMDALTAREFHRCYAIVALPNDASIAFHIKAGFAEVGVLDDVGFKDGRYISTKLLEHKLGDD